MPAAAVPVKDVSRGGARRPDGPHAGRAEHDGVLQRRERGHRYLVPARAVIPVRRGAGDVLRVRGEPENPDILH